MQRKSKLDYSSTLALKLDGGLFYWGRDLDYDAPGDSSSVADSLTSGVVSVVANERSYAVLKSDGSVVAWGDRLNGGGDTSSVATELTANVTHIYPHRYYGFLARKGSGAESTFVAWGGEFQDAIGAVPDELNDPDVTIVDVVSTEDSYAAFTGDGRVICWGEYDCSDIAEGLSANVTSLVSNDKAFAAVKANGSVITWGTDWAGGAKRQEFGTYRDVSDKLASNVTKVFPSGENYVPAGKREGFAFAALKSSGEVVVWGYIDTYSSGWYDEADDADGGVIDIHWSGEAFAQTMSDGSITCWGVPDHGGDCGTVSPGPGNFTAISSSSYHLVPFVAMALLQCGGYIARAVADDPDRLMTAVSGNVSALTWTSTDLAVLKTDGTVQCFGDPNYAGNCSSLNLTDVVSVTGNYRAFAAIHSDGRVTTWGPYENGGDSSEVSQELAAGVVTITGCRDSFVAIKGDGSAVSWPRNMTEPGTRHIQAYRTVLTLV